MSVAPRKHVLTHFDPEDTAAWERGNKLIARRNLIWSVICEHIGFSVWSLFSVLALFMSSATYGISPDDKFYIAATATFVGSLLRVPYTQATARFGGRNWAIFSAVVLLIPTVMALILVMHPPQQHAFAWFMAVAALTGFGGGNFASSMTNINAFYPQRLKGWALGLNAGGGNIGVPVVQLVGLAVISWWSGHPEIVCAVYLVALGIAGLGAALFMDNLDHQTSSGAAMVATLKYRDTWVICLLYIGTFGSFIGFAFAFGQVLQRNYLAGHPASAAVTTAAATAAAALFAAKIAWIGPLLGSLTRPYGGKLSDKLGGGKVTFYSFLAMALASVVVIASSVAADRNDHKTTALTMTGFVIGFIALFVVSGLANGSVYKIIPSVWDARARTLPDMSAAERLRWSRSMSGALIGIAGAAGGLGGVGINLVLRASYQSSASATMAFWVFLGCYLVMAAVTWGCYVRLPRHARTATPVAATAREAVTA